MLDAPLAVSVLHSLRPHTAVTLTATGERALVMCQSREHVTVLVGAAVRVVNRWECEPVLTAEVTDAALRGLGRTAYRGGAMMHEAVTFAEDAIGRTLTALERLLVCDGWTAERAEVCQ